MVPAVDVDVQRKDARAGGLIGSPSNALASAPLTSTTASSAHPRGSQLPASHLTVVRFHFRYCLRACTLPNSNVPIRPNCVITSFDPALPLCTVSFLASLRPPTAPVR